MRKIAEGRYVEKIRGRFVWFEKDERFDRRDRWTATTKDDEKVVAVGRTRKEAREEAIEEIAAAADRRAKAKERHEGLYEETPAEAGERAARADVRRAKEEIERDDETRRLRDELTFCVNKLGYWANWLEESGRKEGLLKSERDALVVDIRDRAEACFKALRAEPDLEEPVDEIAAQAAEEAAEKALDEEDAAADDRCANCYREADRRRKFDREPFCLECIRDHGEDEDDYEAV
jgi:hypothetical protein